jgi:hypothetical protein
MREFSICYMNDDDIDVVETDDIKAHTNTFLTLTPENCCTPHTKTSKQKRLLKSITYVDINYIELESLNGVSRRV